jgi:hypothetical protein
MFSEKIERIRVGGRKQKREMPYFTQTPQRRLENQAGLLKLNRKSLVATTKKETKSPLVE